jgi:hypothetical protein
MGKRSVPRFEVVEWLCEEGWGVAAGGGGEQVGEVLVEVAALDAAGGVGGEQSRDSGLAGLALAAE